MPKKIEIDNDRLLQMVSDKIPQNEIMQAFGLKTSTQLKVAYANALMEAGQAPALKSVREANKNDKPETTIKVNNRGNIVIPKDLATHWGFRIGDTFEAQKSHAGISLKLNEKGLNIPGKHN